MKKKVIIIVFTISVVLISPLFAQVAINTDGSSANPSAMLDIKSDTAGLLIPRMTVAQRDAINNPAQGLMVFITDDSTFYFYKKTAWLELSTGENGWIVFGDTVYNTTSRIGIGTSSPLAKLDIRNSTSDTGLYIQTTSNSNISYGTYSYISGDGSGPQYAATNKLDGAGSGLLIGVYNLIDNSGYGKHYGTYNALYGSGGTVQYGVSNFFGGTGTGAQVGVDNWFDNSEAYSLIGSHSTFQGEGSSPNYGTSNLFLGGGSGLICGASNVLVGSGDGMQYGAKVSVENSGNNIHYGTYSSLSGSGTGDKYGSFDSISYNAGGTHYGVYSDVVGNTNYAGYFKGRMYVSDSVGIGRDSATALLDVNGSFRLEDGHQALGNILVTDDEGFASWANGDTISAGGWTVNGNYVYNLGDSVGIGTASPGATLEVSGHIFQSGTGQSIFLGDSTGIHDDLSDNRNVFLGYKAGFKNTTGYSNVAIGPQSLHNSYLVYDNIAIGDSVLYYNNGNNVWQPISGKYNTAIGSKAAVYNLGGYLNTVVGYKAFYENIYGNNNTSLGAYSLSSNTYGDDNTAIGYNALRYNTLGNSNTAIGFAALNFDTTGNNNTAIGYEALFYNKQGNDNTAIGKYALFNNAKSNNVAIGNSALYHGYTAYRSVAIGTNAMHYIPGPPGDSVRNVAIGYDALYGVSNLGLSSSGNRNTAIGYKTMEFNLAGSGNTAIGDSCIASNTNGNNNTAFGCNSLTSNTTGNSNVAIGINSLFKNSVISNLVAIGDSSLYNNGDGASGLYEATQNSAFGSKALYANTTGYYNTALGYKSLQANISGSSNTAAGTLALYTNTSGSYNTSTGNLSLYSNNTGKKNTATGYGSLYLNNSGENNTAIGYNAGRSSTASGNVFIGYQAGYSETGSDKLYIANSNTSTPLIGGDFNVGRVDINGTIKITGGSPASGKILSSDAVGNATWVDGSTVNGGGWTVSGTTLYSLYDYVGIGTSSPSAKLDVAGHIWQTSTGYSVFLGENAGASDDLSSNNNVLIGYNAGTANTSGYDNTALGYKAMEAVTDGAWNTALGHYAYLTGNYSNSTALGDGVSITASSQVRIGHNVSSIGGPQNWTNTSDGRFKTDVTENVPGLAFIEQLRPVTYYLDVEKLDDYTGVSAEYRNDPLAKQAASIASSELRTGFIAQEVEKAAQSVGYNFSGVDTPKNSNDIYGLRYAEFVVPLVKAVQEQQQTIETQNQQMELLKKDNIELKTRLDRLEKLVEKAN